MGGAVSRCCQEEEREEETRGDREADAAAAQDYNRIMPTS